MFILIVLASSTSQESHTGSVEPSDLLHNTTLTKVTVRDGKEKRSIMAALVGLRRKDGHAQQPDPEVARCGLVLRRYVCTVYWEIFVTKKNHS